MKYLLLILVLIFIIGCSGSNPKAALKQDSKCLSEYQRVYINLDDNEIYDRRACIARNVIANLGKDIRNNPQFNTQLSNVNLILFIQNFDLEELGYASSNDKYKKGSIPKAIDNAITTLKFSADYIESYGYGKEAQEIRVNADLLSPSLSGADATPLLTSTIKVMSSLNKRIGKEQKSRELKSIMYAAILATEAAELITLSKQGTYQGAGKAWNAAAELEVKDQPATTAILYGGRSFVFQDDDAAYFVAVSVSKAAEHYNMGKIVDFIDAGNYAYGSGMDSASESLEYAEANYDKIFG